MPQLEIKYEENKLPIDLPKKKDIKKEIHTLFQMCRCGECDHSCGCICVVEGKKIKEE